MPDPSRYGRTFRGRETRVSVRLLAGLLLSGIFSGVIGCSTGELDDAERAKLASTWELYQVADASWDVARDRWYERGGEARILLIDLLTREMLRQSLERGWRRPQRELLLLPSEDTVPRLVFFARQVSDPALLEILADTLGGFAAVEPVIDALENPEPGDSRLFSLYAMQALVRTGGGRALDFVAGKLRVSEAWEERAAAAGALGSARLSDRPRASEILAGAIGAELDASVVRRSLGALRELDEIQAAPAVAALIQAGTWTSDDLLVREAAIETLRGLTGRKVDGDDPQQWRLVADRAAGRG